MCRFNAFCCGCSLTSGAIMGAIITVLTAIGLIMSGTELIKVADWLNASNATDHKAMYRKTINRLLKNRLHSFQQDIYNPKSPKVELEWEMKYDDRKKCAIIANTFAFSAFGLAALLLVIFICLAIAIVKKKPKFVLPWLIGSIVNLMCHCVIVVIVLVLGECYLSSVTLVLITMHIYNWVVMYNYYLDLKEAPKKIPFYLEPTITYNPKSEY